MIPKVIHYCWFGRAPLPPLAKKCIASWRRYMPDYEIKEWNEDNFDVEAIAYTAEAYKAKKYAFVSDYARFWILHRHGGVYFDTDVEVIRPIDDIVAHGAFMGFENEEATEGNTAGVNPGLGLGIEPGHPLMGELLAMYEQMHYLSPTGEIVENQTVVHHTTALLKSHGLRGYDTMQEVAGITIYPKDYFCPISITTKHLEVTPNTRTIHHYSASWMDKTWKDRTKERLQRMLPKSLLVWWNKRKSTSKDTTRR